MIGFATNHHAIDMFEMFQRFGIGLDPAIDFNQQIRTILLQAINIFITQGRHIAVFFRR